MASPVMAVDNPIMTFDPNLASQPPPTTAPIEKPTLSMNVATLAPLVK